MAYVDLNPIRAGMASTPENSDHTSIKERIRPSFHLGEAVREQVGLHALIKFELPASPLATFEGAVKTEEQGGILFALTDYIELVDMTGRILREDKRGAIPNHLPPILQRLEIDELAWLENAAEFEKHYSSRFARPRRPASVAA